MAKVNELKVVKNGNFNNINLSDMDDGDSIVVTKKFQKARRTEKESQFKAKDGSKKMYTSIQIAGTYNGVDVGFFLNGTKGDNGAYTDATVYADQFDNNGGEGDDVRITCKKWLTKDAKGKDMAARSFVIEKV
jgi:hypothetical protein